MEVQVFNNLEFGSVRTMMIDGEPYFVGKDVAEILGYKDVGTALLDHVDDEDKKVLKYKAFGDLYPTLWSRTNDFSNKIVISESGLYNLIFESKLPAAKRFKRWVTSEVLPSIRKNGGYIANQENLTPEQIVANALVVAQRIIADKDKLIDEMKPKALFADAVASSSSDILVGNLAKILKGNGVDIGQNRLFKWMRENGYLIKQTGDLYNTPTQRSMELELFRVKESTVMNPDGSVRITKTTKVTGKGQEYFINKFLIPEGNNV